MQLTPLQLHKCSRRGWPDGPQRVTAEEEDRGLQPVDEECKAKEATQKSGYMKFKPKDDDGTHLKHRSAAKTRHKQACHSSLPPCPRVPLPQPDTQVPIKIDRLVDGKYWRLPNGGSRTGRNDPRPSNARASAEGSFRTRLARLRLEAA